MSAINPEQSRPMLVFGNKNYSSWSLRPWLLMHHFGIDFEERKIFLFRDDTHDQLRPLSPNLRVPVLRVAEETIWDSLAICEYVSEQYLGGKGWPSEPRARAQARSVCAEMHAGFSELRAQWPMNCRLTQTSLVNEGLAQDIARIEELWAGCLLRFGGEEGYLFNQFSIADCFFAPVVMRFKSYQPALSEVSERYMERVLENHSLRLWVEEGCAETEVIQEDEIDFINKLAK